MPLDKPTSIHAPEAHHDQVAANLLADTHQPIPKLLSDNHLKPVGNASGTTDYIQSASEGALGALIPSMGVALKAETIGAGIGKLSLSSTFDSTTFLKGAGAIAADSVVDFSLQKLTHHNEAFKPTALEMFGVGLAAAAPLDIRMKSALIGLSWVAGRVENRFEK